MGLTEAKKKNLEDKAFDNLFTAQRQKWERLARSAQGYARRNMTEGNQPRPDDVAQVLLPLVAVDKSFRDHQYENKARQRRYLDWFTDYIIDQILFQRRRR